MAISARTRCGGAGRLAEAGIRVLLVSGTLVLGACAGMLDPADFVAAPPCAAAGAPVIVEPLPAIRTGIVRSDSATVPAATSVAPELLALSQPRQVAVAGSEVFIADAGLGELLRTDRNGQSFTPIARLGLSRVGGIAADRSGSLFVASPAEGAILQFDRSGRLERRYMDASALPVPVDVAVDDVGNLFVVDELGARVVVLNRLGQVTGVLGERGDRPNPLMSAVAVAAGPDGAYVLDAAGRKVVVIGRGAEYLRELPLDPATPGTAVSLAVDRAGRVFVGWRGSGTLSVLTRGAATWDRVAVLPGSGEVGDLWVDDLDLLYVVDTLGAAIVPVHVPARCD